MTIGEKIGELRRLKGVSQEILASELGVSRQAVSKWEQGQSKPSTENLKCLAAYFDIDLEQFLDLNTNIGIVYDSQAILLDLMHNKMNLKIVVTLISLFLMTFIPAVYLKIVEFDRSVTLWIATVSGGIMFVLALFIISLVMRYVYKDCINRGIRPWFFVIISISVVGLVIYLLCRDSISEHSIQNKKGEQA
ncbi:MAG: helix-turn-helix domain-containing protein [Beduini sp.]|uniref:helix-turn-helix domain-containing protein n=1 Tax=Beduini sp. TaxID=1922300 RepID=UPI0039A185C5